MEDLLLNTDKELDIQNGDFVIGESTLQHQEAIIMDNPGEYKENPLITVGIYGFLKDDDAAGLLAEVKAKFEKDGMTVHSVGFNDGKLVTDANY